MSEHATDIELVSFGDNRLMADLSGEHDVNLMILEKALGVRIDPRGNRLSIAGPPAARARALRILAGLYRRLERGESLSEADIRAAARLDDAGAADRADPATPTVRTPKRTIAPRSPNQRRYLEALARADLVFGVGPAGTGKTYLAVAHAVSLLLSGAVERVVLSRPALEAGERIGFLPGDIKEKVDPYLRPLYDALGDMLHGDYLERRFSAGDIEIAPIAFMRGRTLARAAIILDEAQNATVAQMKMFLTRFGEGSHMAVTGDPSQSDLPPGEISGLADALARLKDVEGVETVRFSREDVVRHPLVSRIIEAYEDRPGAVRAESRAVKDR
ncbi:PhoH family protein [Amphiplicatus metriothermophilus]|uniref:PhoH-like protein n=1 Tax=Amphiplicatus metriothermophilus TaxID=1519374 RepID=A0A239PJZ2_9PROT|nr:PhoH family protein [Amphiplicatus metriothermophilus]MBB5517549.1 phosphate starvation-inducible PhoH-like protein [Amphiplicatus metriothermophilus]SNT68116.1 phosphate starvation-inducible protein PhoH [Amphiplicatus metriothermophilus]